MIIFRPKLKANHDFPSETNFNGVNPKGKVIFLKRVTVTDYDFTNGNEFLFQGSDNNYMYHPRDLVFWSNLGAYDDIRYKGTINNVSTEFRHIIVPLTDPNSVNQFLTDPGNEPFFIDQVASVIPKIIKKKKVGERFPLLGEDITATRDIILQLVEFYSIVRRFYDDSKENIDFFIGMDNHGRMDVLV